MHNLSARPVFFVEDTPRAIELYTNNLGFTLDRTHEEKGRPSPRTQAVIKPTFVVRSVRSAALSRIPKAIEFR